MVVKLRNATGADLERIKGDLLHDWKKSRPIDSLTEWSKSLYIGEDLVAVAGMYMLWTNHSGVAECWLLLGSKADKYKIEVVKRAKEVIALAFQELNLHRMQAVIRADFKEGLRFIEHLNFVEEGRLRAYCEDKTNAIMYSIVKEG